MIELNTENSPAIILAAQEMLDNGQLWISIAGEDFYIPELILQLKNLEQNNNLK